MKRQIKFFFLLLLTIFIFPLEVQAASSQMGLREIYRVLNIIDRQYVHDVNDLDLLNGAVSGMKKALQAARISVPDLSPIQEGLQPRDRARAFEKRFSSACEAASGKLGESAIAYGALKGAVEAIHNPPYKDPHTVLFSTKERNEWEQSLNGDNYYGIGIYLELDKNNHNLLTIVEPIEDTPAYKSGLLPGDVIVRIDGNPAGSLNLDQAVGKIRGARGSQVTLAISRKSFSSPRKFVITRDFIHVKSAVARMMKNRIGYVKLRVFGENTGQEFEEALRYVEDRNAQALILDMRNNGGGYVTGARDVCGKFLPLGSLVVTTTNPKTGQRDSVTTCAAPHDRLPMVILVNNFTASSAEIVSGALQDDRVAILIGSRTFGKGSIQTLFDLRDGGALKMTTALYMTPSGRNIDKKGIQPDIAVPMDAHLVGRPQDAQLRAAYEYLTKK
ncbi:MAG: S41 family peptidase [bacterium]